VQERNELEHGNLSAKDGEEWGTEQPSTSLTKSQLRPNDDFRWLNRATDMESICSLCKNLFLVTFGDLER